MQTKLRVSVRVQIDPSVTWEFVAWLRTVTKLPIVVKVSASCQSGPQLHTSQADMFVTFVRHNWDLGSNGP